MSTENPHSEKSTLDLLQEINAGLVNPKLFDPPDRQRCVEFLSGEGYTQPQISQVLKCSEKTIFRDLKEIRARNEISPSAESAKQLIGDVFKKAMNHHDFLVRLARAKDSPAAVKVESELAAWKILKELIEKMQSLGYLPIVPNQVVGQFDHHITTEAQDKPLAEVKSMIVELENVAKDTQGFSQEMTDEINQLKLRVEKAELIYDVKKLEEQQKQNQDRKEDTRDE